MNYYTVVVTYSSVVIVTDVLPASRLTYTAPNCCYYVRNQQATPITDIQKDTIANAVLNHAIAQNIPAIAVRKFVQPRLKKPTSDMKTLFD
jgi:hypothetical protein